MYFLPLLTLTVSLSQIDTESTPGSSIIYLPAVTQLVLIGSSSCYSDSLLGRIEKLRAQSHSIFHFELPQCLSTTSHIVPPLSFRVQSILILQSQVLELSP